MTYIPRRDYRFEYLHDVLNWMEEHVCSDCIFRKMDQTEYIMCHELEGKIFLEEPIEEWEDLGDLGLSCNLKAT